MADRTALHFRLPTELVERLNRYMRSIPTWKRGTRLALVEQALTEFLDRHEEEQHGR